MKKPGGWESVEIDEWRRYTEMKRLRRALLGMLDYGWDGSLTLWREKIEEGERR